MAKQFTFKSEDTAIQLATAAEYYGKKQSLGIWREFSLYSSSSAGLVPTSYWYAVKDDIAYVDRGLAGLLDFIDKLTTVEK